MLLLLLAEFAYINVSHSATGQSPFFAKYGFHLSFLPDFVPKFTGPAVQSTVDFFNHNNKLLQEAVTTAIHKLACYSKKLAPSFWDHSGLCEKEEPAGIFN